MPTSPRTLLPAKTNYIVILLGLSNKHLVNPRTPRRAAQTVLLVIVTSEGANNTM